VDNNEYEVIAPTDEELMQAVKAAELLREHTDDEQRVAHCLIYLAQRNKQLEDIVEMVERYLKFGTAEHEHSQLIKMLESLHDSENWQRDQFFQPEN
jgi:hypothetical protein